MGINFLARYVFDINEEDNTIKAQWYRYYIEVFMSSLTKTIGVFASSFLLGIFPLTLISYLSFGIIRSKALGWHALSSWYCGVQSIFFFVGIPYFLQNFSFTISFKLILILVSLLIVSRYAPQCTEQSEPLSQENKSWQKKSSIGRVIILSVVILLCPRKYAIGVGIALFIQAVMLVPITKKIIQGKRKKDEKN